MKAEGESQGPDFLDGTLQDREAQGLCSPILREPSNDVAVLNMLWHGCSGVGHGRSGVSWIISGRCCGDAAATLVLDTRGCLILHWRGCSGVAWLTSGWGLHLLISPACHEPFTSRGIALLHRGGEAFVL